MVANIPVENKGLLVRVTQPGHMGKPVWASARKSRWRGAFCYKRVFQSYKARLSMLKNRVFRYTLIVFGIFVLISVLIPDEKNEIINTDPVTEIDRKEQVEALNPVIEDVAEESDVEDDIVKNQQPPPKAETTEYYQVVKVVDGDTVDLNIDGKTERIRLIGIDTPETVDPRKPVECFGTEASNKAKELLSGKRVALEKDQSQGDRDVYGRLLGYIVFENGGNFNKLMIEQGYAHEYTYNTPYKYQAEFKASQKLAQANQSGLWSPDTCNGLTKSDTQPNTTQPSGKFYTSSHHSAKYYYPEGCDAWKSLSESYLKSFNTLEDLQDIYERILSPQCN